MKAQLPRETSLLQKVVSSLADKESREWPPTCLGFFYQPPRPHTIERDPKVASRKNK